MLKGNDRNQEKKNTFCESSIFNKRKVAKIWGVIIKKVKLTRMATIKHKALKR